MVDTCHQLGVVSRPSLRDRLAACRGTGVAGVNSAIFARGLGALLVIAPHPDDEVLGCGWLMQAVTKVRGRVVIAWLTDGDASHGGDSGSGHASHPTLIATRRREALNGLAALAIEPEAIYHLGARDGFVRDFATPADNTDWLQGICERHTIDTVVVTAREDNHPDHRAAFTLASGLRVGQLYAYPVSARYDGAALNAGYNPLAIGPLDVEAKRRALCCHASQAEGNGALFPMRVEAIERFCTEPELFYPVAVSMSPIRYPIAIAAPDEKDLLPDNLRAIAAQARVAHDDPAVIVSGNNSSDDTAAGPRQEYYAAPCVYGTVEIGTGSQRMRHTSEFADGSLRPYDPVAAARDIEATVYARAGEVDAAAAYPAADIADLADAGLLTACLPQAFGGVGLGHDNTTINTLREVLTTIGRANLTVGRLYEGHVNAMRLVAQYGCAEATAQLATEAIAGRPSGVWNAESGTGLSAEHVDGGWRLCGHKIHCSGSDSIRRPVVTAHVDGGALMMLPEATANRVDLSVWRAAGMRGTATGTVDFDGLFVPDVAVVGAPGDYYRSPSFSGGAWRVIAVQLGGLDRIMALHSERLNIRGGADLVIRARFARAGAAHEAARLLVREAANRAENDGVAADIDAYVDLARGGFEELALVCIEATRRNVGLSSFIAPDPLDRTLRDLETYLRQPFLDASRDNAAGWLLAHGGRFA